MIKNLLQTGTVFDYSADDQNLLDLELSEDLSDKKINNQTPDKTFEDED